MQIYMEFLDTNILHNLGQTTRHSDSQRKIKSTCRMVDFAVPVDHGVKLKERAKRDNYWELAKEQSKYWDLARELKVQRKMKVKPIVIGMLWTIPKGLIKGVENLKIRGQGEIILFMRRKIVVVKWRFNIESYNNLCSHLRNS